MSQYTIETKITANQVMIKLKCLLGFHKFEFSRYEEPMQYKTVTPLALHFDGRISGLKLVSFGFLHYGLVSDCVYCGKTINSEAIKLPIIEPLFNAKKN